MCVIFWLLITLVKGCLWLLKNGQPDFFCVVVEEMKLAEILTALLSLLLFPWHNLSCLSAAAHDAKAYTCSFFLFHAGRHGSLLQLHGGM